MSLYAPMVRRLARALEGPGYVVGLAVADLEQEGALALLEAARKRPAADGEIPPAFAWMAVRWGILRAVSRARPAGCRGEGAELPRLVRLAAAGEQLEGGEPVQAVDALPAPAPAEPASFDAYWLRAAVERLPPRERGLIVLRFGLQEGPPITQEAAAIRMEVRAQRASQLEQQALGRLRGLLGGGPGGGGGGGGR